MPIKCQFSEPIKAAAKLSKCLGDTEGSEIVTIYPELRHEFCKNVEKFKSLLLLAVSTEATTTYHNFFRTRVEVQGIYSDDGL